MTYSVSADLAVVCVQNFYLDLRRQHHSADSTPITTRQLESLIRLTQVQLLNDSGSPDHTLSGPPDHAFS